MHAAIAGQGAEPLHGLVRKGEGGPALPGVPDLTAPPATGLYLHWDGARLALCRAGTRPLRLSADFAAGAHARRRRRATPGREHIARACGIRGARRPAIIDATAGPRQRRLPACRPSVPRSPSWSVRR
ncbi:MAG: class I SAM-dependent methyltransferase [Arhodomonas sp.]|nr:class I SAM-dependent methyltransferase [Arhodomonas sp.]